MTDLRPFTDTPSAHRGLHGAGVPENSLAAFLAACDAGVGIELDLQPVGDDAVAVFHDYDLQRMCGVDGELAALDREGLRRLRLDGTDEHVPTLDEVLDLVDGHVPLALELKQPREAIAAEALCRRVAALLDGYGGPVAVMSFDPVLLRWFARNRHPAPRVQLGATRRIPDVAEKLDALGIPRWKELALSSLAVSLISTPTMVGYDVRALPHPAPTLARRLGRPLFAGVVTDVDELEAAVRHADGVCFDGIAVEAVQAAWSARDG